MKLTELNAKLIHHPDLNVRFLLPNGEFVPAHAHVTEVARIDKRFVDCGGTMRNDSFCRLQTWVADDLQHRLTARKLFIILGKAASFLKSDELEIDVEHQMDFITQFPLEAITASGNELVLRLAERHTACLAMEKCLPPLKKRPSMFPSFKK